MSKPFSRALNALSMLGILAPYGLAQSETTSINDYKMTNKKIVATFLGAVMKHQTAFIRQFACAEYMEHNPLLPNGLKPFSWFNNCFKSTWCSL